MKLIPEKTLLQIWKALPPQLGSVVGEDARLAEPVLARAWSHSGKRYYAELELVEPRVAKLWMSFSLPLAIASAGHLVMRPKNAIRSNIESATFDGDDLDAMGECVNTFCSALNEAVRGELGDDHRIVFRTGSLEAPDISAVGPLSLATGRLEFGDLATGELELVVPDAVFVAVREEAEDDEGDEDDEDDEDGDGEQDAHDAEGKLVDVSADAPPEKRRKPKRKKSRKGGDDDDASDPASAGPLLSPEELAAIREATTAMTKGLAVIVADRPSARELWKESLTSIGAEFELVANHHQLLATCRTRNVDVVVVDADWCPSGGLTLLAAIRGAIGVPARLVVVASLATLPHLVACYAGGASEYLTRPLDDATLGRIMGPS
ncbi:MAG: response regulator [Deltaproteobacteria bacterium]|nr:response regulator [Nannocystaceae bacterium]